MESLNKKNFINYLNSGDIYHLYIYSVGIIIYGFALGRYDKDVNLSKNKCFQNDCDRLFKSADNLQTTFVSYSSISSYIYNAFTPGKGVDDINGLCTCLKNELIKRIRNSDSDHISNGDIVLAKTIEYINLGSIQMDALHNKQEIHIENLSHKLSVEGSSISQKLANLKTNLKNIKDEFEHSKSNLYGHFVSVLGIFITIIVAMSGGLGAISNSINAISNWNTNIYYVLLLSLLFAILLLFITFFMFLCISKIIGKPISESKSKDIFHKYPVISRFEIVLIVLFLGLWLSYLCFLK